MAKGDLKVDPCPIIAAHYKTLSDQNTGKQRWQDYAWLLGLPGMAAVALYLRCVKLSEPASTGLLTVTGILGAFLFGVMMTVSERAAAWLEKSPKPSAATTDTADYLSELASNAGYSSLVSIVAAVGFVVTATSHGGVLRVASAVAIFVAGHLLLTLMLVMKRIHVLTQQRLTNARTGAGQGPAEES